jgi:hypothetical protein
MVLGELRERELLVFVEEHDLCGGGGGHRGDLPETSEDAGR